MKVELVGINKETDAPPTAQSATSEPAPPPKTVVIARLCSPDVPAYHGISVPYEMIQGAQVGDEFELHLERIPKS